MAYTQVFAMAIGLLALAIMGIQDLKYRRVEHEWLYLIVLICGLFSGGSWAEKIFCLIVIPAMLLLIAYFREKKRLKRNGENPCLALAIKQIGGGDLKLIGCTGFLAGPFILAAGILLSLPLCIPFLKNKTLGMEDPAADEVDSGKIPLFTVLAAALIIVYVILFAISIIIP